MILLDFGEGQTGFVVLQTGTYFFSSCMRIPPAMILRSNR